MRICSTTDCGALNENHSTQCHHCHNPLRNTIDVLDAGTILEGYEIIGYIGHGGFGVVYEGRRLTDNSRVAIKETFDPTSITQFRREFERLHRLHHENLPRYYAIFTAHGNGYLVMELVEGKNLSDLLEQQGGPLLITQVEGFAVQLAAAVGYLHNQQPPLLHRDIKPANIRLRPDGVLKLVDFGIAKAERTNTETFTRASQRAFSTIYAPPEQTILHNKVTTRSDIYSFGATLYHLLTNQYPTGGALRAASSLDPLTPPSQLNPAIPKSLNDVILRAMALRPEERHESVEALLYELRIANHIPRTQRRIPMMVGGLIAGVLLLWIVGSTLMQSLIGEADQAANGGAFTTQTPVTTSQPISTADGSQPDQEIGLNPANSTPTITATQRATPTIANTVTSVGVGVEPTPSAFTTSTGVNATATTALPPTVTVTVVRATRPPATATQRPIATTVPVNPQRSPVLLVAPAPQETFAQGVPIVFTWQGVPLNGGESYLIRIWKQAVPDIAEMEFSTTSTSAQVSTLNPDTYQWTVQVLAGAAPVAATRSEVRTFAVVGQSEEPTSVPQPTEAPDPTFPPQATAHPTEPPLPTRDTSG